MNGNSKRPSSTAGRCALPSRWRLCFGLPSQGPWFLERQRLLILLTCCELWSASIQDGFTALACVSLEGAVPPLDSSQDLREHLEVSGGGSIASDRHGRGIYLSFEFVVEQFCKLSRLWNPMTTSVDATPIWRLNGKQRGAVWDRKHYRAKFQGLTRNTGELSKAWKSNDTE
jgi:hypothetical protein